MIEKPKVIYRKELPKVGLQHKFGSYEDGENKKLNTLQVIYYGLRKIDMLPKYHRQYDAFMLNFKAGLYSLLICGVLTYTCFHSSVMDEKLSNISKDYDGSDTYFNRALNFLIEQWDVMCYNISKLFKN